MSGASKEPHRSDWMYTAQWGVAAHYLADTTTDVDAWNRQIDAFDVQGLARQLSQAQSGYFLITIGQNSGFYLAPNAAYDHIVGADPGRCARRVLVADLHAALAPHGIRLLVYLPSGGPAMDEKAAAALGWEWGFEGGWPNGNQVRTGKRLAEFQRYWESIIREWSLRWGEKVSGWWFDGCYFADEMYRHVESPNFSSFSAAARAGNPDFIQPSMDSHIPQIRVQSSGGISAIKGIQASGMIQIDGYCYLTLLPRTGMAVGSQDDLRLEVAVTAAMTADGSYRRSTLAQARRPWELANGFGVMAVGDGSHV